MYDLTLLEDCYKKFSTQLKEYLPDGLIPINLKLLQQFDLLHFQNSTGEKPKLMRSFHVIESFEKITLLNDEFIVWIVPEKVDSSYITLCLVAKNKQPTPILELGFSASGSYNHSRLFLNVLEKFLSEIHENEQLIDQLKN